jgi:hypothetical protein
MQLTAGAFVFNNGSVGIGTVPTRAKLEISGSVNTGINIGGYLNRNGASTINNTDYNTDFSIWCSSRIAATEVWAFSDARIKNIQGRSDGASDLAILSRIEITDYTPKDVIAKGTSPHKKVIAQQVETVYPQAVTKSTDVVPDIYRKATVKDGWVKLATDLKVGERVRLIAEKAEGIHEVIEMRDGAFRTAFQPAGENIFVYGREVKDFRSVDYEAIAMLNVSATQELAKRLEKLEARESHVAELERKAGRVATLEREVADLKKMVAQLAEVGKGSKQTTLATLQSQLAGMDESLQGSPTTVRASLDRE